MRVPRLLIAAPASGQGKTTIAVGIMAALTRSGYAVAPAKVGPDYIDPGYHALATGRPSRNLDTWLTSPDLVTPLLLNGFRTPAVADLAIIEGVMGLFDGQLATDGFASSAHVATLTASPVVLVIDISSASRTVAATVHGLRTFDPNVSVVGVVLNKAGSPRHATEVRTAIEQLGLPVLGVLPRDGGISAPSRHLGLVPAAERLDAIASLDRLADQTAAHLDLDTLVALAGSAPDLEATPWSAPVISRPSGPAVVAVAGGRAFTFRYAETEELLRAAGCEPVTFDPATDTALPSGTRGLYLGGGFPEAHAAALAGNSTLLREVREAIASGVPTVAECAGMLYLARSLDDVPMVGALPARAAMHPRLTLRYVRATLPVDGPLGAAGTQVHAHEFHRTAVDPPAGPEAAWAVDGVGHGFAVDPAGTGTATLHASYLHVHWAGNPALAASFADAVHHSPDRSEHAIAAPAPRDQPGAPGDQVPNHHDQPVTPGDQFPTHLTHDLDHHGDVEVRGSGLVDLAVNVRLSEPPPWLATIIRDSIVDLAAYPDVAAARAAVAARHAVPDEMVLLTSGAAEAFTLIARAIDGRHPLVVHPQFTEPEAALRRVGRVPSRLLLRAETGFTLDPRLVDPQADLVFIGNPTNPTGVLHSRQAVAALRAPGRVLVVDEAFADAIPGERESLVGADLQGVLVLRSLTKTWGIAGLRAGYILGDKELVAALARQQAPWSVSTPAAAVMAATATPDALALATDAALKGAHLRAHLVRALEGLGLAPVAGHAPFVLVEVGPGVRERLRDMGFAVRRGDTFPGLTASWVRIAVREESTTDALVSALRDLVPARAPSHETRADSLSPAMREVRS